MFFPPEIWETILQHLDAIKLTKFRAVCKLWKDIIDEILEKQDHWYSQCLADIPKQFWNIFYEKFCPEIQTDGINRNNSKKWIAMYKSWVTSKNVKKCDIDWEYFNPLLEHQYKQHISCFKISNNLMAIGTSSGYVIVYDINCLCEAPIFTGDHLEYVKSIQFLRSGTNVTVVSCSVNNHIKYWDIQQKTLIKRKYGQIICADHYHLCIAMRDAFAVEHSFSNALSEYNYASHNIVLMDINDDMVILYTQAGNYEKYPLAAPKVQWSCKYLPPPPFKIRRYYAFKPEILVYITDLGLLGFSVGADKWREYSTYNELNGTPTAVLIYGHLLVIGLSTGNIHMYYCKDFKALDFNRKNSKLVTLDPAAIISMEIFITNEEQYLIAAQMEKISFIKFIM